MEYQKEHGKQDDVTDLINDNRPKPPSSPTPHAVLACLNYLEIIVQHHFRVNRRSVRLESFLTTIRKLHADATDITFYQRNKDLQATGGRLRRWTSSFRQRTVDPYFSRRQLIDPLVSTVLDSASTSKPRLSRYLSVSTEPLPIIETP